MHTHALTHEPLKMLSTNTKDTKKKASSSKTIQVFSKTREPIFGQFDCLYKETHEVSPLGISSLPQIGKLTIHRTFAIFTSSFNGNVSRKLKQRDLDSIDARSRISLIFKEKERERAKLLTRRSSTLENVEENVEDAKANTASNDAIKNEKMSQQKGKTFQLQFVDNTECFERLVKKWKLERGRRPRNEEKEDFAGGEKEEDATTENNTNTNDGGEKTNEDGDNDVDLKRIAYKPAKGAQLRRSDSTLDGDLDDLNDESASAYGAADALIRTMETMAGKLPFGAGKKAKYTAYFLRQQIKATRRMTKKSVKYTMRYVNRRSRELALARKRQSAKSAVFRKVEAVDVEKEVSKTLFVRLIRAKNVLAMDDGGTSDPFTEIRFRGLQNVSRTIEKTCDPEWEQTFTFNIPNGKRVLDASDAVELYVYDRDQALNDFIGYAKLDLEGEEVQDEESMKLNRKKMSSAWKRVDSASEGGGLIIPSTKLLNESFESENGGESPSLGISKDKKPIPPVATKVRYDKHTGKKYTQKTIHLSSLPENQQPSFFDVNHLKEKLMFWEGERKFTGTITCEYWFGSRHDAEFRASAQPKLRTANNELTASIQHYCDPVTALLRVDVRAGRNIVNLDCEKGEDGSEGGSDPYVEVSVIDAVDRSKVKKSTHYIEDSRNPLWNRTFTFLTSQPYSNTMQLKCYDYDGATSFDDVIGCYSVPLHELPVRVGVKTLPEYRWVTLRHPKTGSEKNEFGVPYGEIEVRAYIDEEYFDHLHGGNATRAVGKLSVDILEANGIDKIPQGAYCVCKIGPYWSRLETVKKTEFSGELGDEDMQKVSEDDDDDGVDAGGDEGEDGEARPPKPKALNDDARRAKKIAKMIENANKIRWNKRLIYPVSEPSDEVIVSVFDAENDDVIGTIKLPLSCMEDGVRYENECVLMMNANVAIGDIVKNGTLTLAFTFTHFKGGALVARKYIKPKLPAKWYFYPLSPNETQRVLRAQKDVLVKKLLQANPPIPEKVSQHILAYSQHTVNVMSIKSSIARLEKSMSGFVNLHQGLTFTFSWESIPLTVLAQCLLVFWIYHPEWLIPSFCFGLAMNALLLFPGRYQRVLDRMVPNEFLSVGIAAAPEDIDDALKLKDQEDREKEIESKDARMAANLDLDGEDFDDKEKAAKDAKEAEKKKKSMTKPKEAATWDSINPIAQLQKQLEEVKLLITQSQSILDQVAGGVERFIGIFTWAEPRVTAMTILVVLALGWATLYIQTIVRVGFELMTGVVAKVVFKIVTPERVKFACTCGLLWLLRHPAIFPDDVRRAIQEEKNARIEAQLAAEAKKASGEMNAQPEEVDLELEEALKDAPPKVDYLFDPRPMPPLNVFFRIPTRSSQLV